VAIPQPGKLQRQAHIFDIYIHINQVKEDRHEDA
jgi:hypothetical protein